MSKTLERLLAIHSAPAICGIKASNLICIDYSDSLFFEIEELNKKYSKLRFYVLKNENGKALVLVYRKTALEKVLSNLDNLKFLKDLGYDTSSISMMLEHLKERLSYSNFPHEIGVFLGYDLSDILAFIENKVCLYVGYWKVYSDLNRKIELFNKYTRCKDTVINLIDKGFPLENFMR